MDAVERLALAVGITITKRGGLPLVHQRDCLRLIDECEHQSVLILGFEGFRLDGTAITPDLDMIADFSDAIHEPWIEACAKAARESERIIRSLDDDELWFDFTVQEKADPKLS